MFKVSASKSQVSTSPTCHTSWPRLLFSPEQDRVVQKVFRQAGYVQHNQHRNLPGSSKAFALSETPLAGPKRKWPFLALFQRLWPKLASRGASGAKLPILGFEIVVGPKNTEASSAAPHPGSQSALQSFQDFRMRLQVQTQACLNRMKTLRIFQYWLPKTPKTYENILTYGFKFP